MKVIRKVLNSTVDEILNYNEIPDFNEGNNDIDNDAEWLYKQVLSHRRAHQGSLITSYYDYKGPAFSVL